VLVAVWVLAAAAAAAEVPNAARVNEQVREILADPQYQRDLPGVLEHNAEADEAAPTGASGGRSATVPVVQAAGAVASLAQLVIWMMVAVAVILLVIWLASQLVGRREREAAAQAGGTETAEAAADEPAWLPADAARLAGEGRHGEALHVLLLVAIRRLAERSPRGVEPSRTSRELIRLVPLAPDARLSFEALVRLVEITLFGGLPAGAEEYGQGLAHFQAVTGARA
jgi:hypothetical protein